jgi:hypothetical protein
MSDGRYILQTGLLSTGNRLERIQPCFRETVPNDLPRFVCPVNKSRRERGEDGLLLLGSRHLRGEDENANIQLKKLIICDIPFAPYPPVN